MPRSPDPVTGGPRPLLQARIETPVLERVRVRADSETEEGNLSEMTRRLVLYALPRMPHGWVPAEDQHPTATTTEETP